MREASPGATVWVPVHRDGGDACRPGAAMDPDDAAEPLHERNY
jgi:hypothetical protein